MVERKEICVNDMTSCIKEQREVKNKKRKKSRKFPQENKYYFHFYDEVTNKTTAAGLPVRSTYAHVSSVIIFCNVFFLSCFLEQSCGCGEKRKFIKKNIF